MNTSSTLRVLILAPIENDARLTKEFLTKAAIEAFQCGDMEELLRVTSQGCGTLVIAEESLRSSDFNGLKLMLDNQPSWSELPIILITPSGGSSVERKMQLSELGSRSNVLLIERPFRPSTLISLTRVALKSRRRQYEVRALLQESTEHKDRLEFVLKAAEVGIWTIDLRSHELQCSDTYKRFFNVEPSEPFTYESFIACIHPEDLDHWVHGIEKAIQFNSSINLVFRIILPEGQSRWMQLKGRVEQHFPGRNTSFISGIAQDITQQKESARELEDQANQLRIADRRKNEFVAMLAHELRNPLSSISNAIHVFKENDDGDERAWAMEIVQRQSDQLGRLVDDLLDISRITLGKIYLKREILDAAGCLKNACRAIGSIVSERHHTFTSNIPQGQLWVYADPARLEQIVGNLLTNAAKYTERNGHIWLDAAIDDGDVEIVVGDSGVGIAPERIDEMFVLFSQGERSIARSDGGLGIGLTVVRQLCELHGGSVSAYSEGVGKGSKFVVKLPRVAEPKEHEIGTQTQPSLMASDNRKVLVVDDNKDAANGLAKLLGRRGFNASIAYSGVSALEMAERFNPDIVLLDIGLPEIDGCEVARRLRAKPITQTILIIALSGYGQEDDIRRSMQSGIDHHFVKPVNFAKLLTLLQQPLK